MEQDESSSCLKKNDKYCWICHGGADESMPILIKCIECPRVYHSKCMNDEYSEGFNEPNEDSLDNWLCVECQKLKNENLNQNTYKKVTPDQFNSMLSFAVRRLKYSASEPFQKEVDLVAFPQYNTFIVHPMYIGLMEQKIETKQYVSLEAVLQDTKWIVHNCTIFNGAQNKLTNTAKTLLKMIKHELSEIEVCPDCYLSSITKHSDQWFTEPCRLPHLLVFAKIKGFPFWPAKALKAIGNTDLDVRFFGAHDRSIVSVEKCYWLSKEYPANLRNHAMINMQPSVLELNEHIKKLEMEFGSFKYAPSLMPVDLNDPFVFIDAFKDINCLPSMAENTRNTRKRNFTTPTIMGQLPLISSFASSSATTTPTTLSKPKATPTAISLSNQDAANRRRSNRTTTPQASLTKKENQENDDSIQIAEDEDSEKLNSTTESTIPPDSNNEQQQQQQENNNNSINNRSKRLRKLSNKYSGFSVETIATSGATKRKSVRNSTSINSQSQQEQQQQEITNEVTAKKIRSDSDSNSKTSSSLVYVPKLTSSISSTRSSSNSESETIQSNPNNNNNNHNQINNYEKSEEDDQETQNTNDNESTCSSTYSTSDREKRKELKRREKKLLKEKNKLDKEMAAIKQTEDLTAAASSSSSNHSNFDQQMDSSCNSSSSIIVKIPRFNMNNNNSNSGEDTSSILVSSTSNSTTQQPVGLSPIKIKISRQLQDGNKKSSSFIVDQASNSPTTITTNSTTNVPSNTPSSSSSTQPTLPKLNIGELLNKCKQTLKQNDEHASEEQEKNSESPNKEEDVKEVIKMDTKECVPNEVINKSPDHETINNNKEEEVPLETHNNSNNDSNNEIVSLDSTLETPTASNNTNSEQTLEPGEVPFRSLITTTTTTTNNGNNLLNGIQQMPKKNIIINTIMPIQQNKLRKIAPNLNQTSEPTSTIIIANSNTNNISSTKINLISNNNNNNNNTNIQNKTKREIELEKVIEEKNLKSREMKQFYEKLIREMKQSHELQQQQLIREIKYNCDLKISEVLKEASRKEMKLRVEYERKLNESKFKQWCSCCGKEAIYYCCWNTSYCDEECQKAHWGQHLKTCTRIVGDETNTADTNIKYNDSFTSNGTSYNNNNNNNIEYNHNTDSNGYDPLNKYNQRKQISQQQHKQQQNVQHLQQTPNNNPYQSYISSNNSANIQKKIQIPSNHNKYIINDQTTFATNSSNNNNNNNNNTNNPNRKVTL